MTPEQPSPWGPGNPREPTLRYIFLRFLRHGLLAWGGPVAQIGMMHQELVVRDGWIDEPRFRRTLALYQALPGPEAHELSVYFGHLKRGAWGGLMAGLAFMLPGVVLVTCLAALYVQYSHSAAVAHVVLYGVRPAVVALVVIAIVRLGRASLRGPALATVGLGSAMAAFLIPDANVLVILAIGGLIVLALDRSPQAVDPSSQAHAVLPLGLAAALPALQATGTLALVFLSLKVGLLTFGGAYTSIPFLQEAAVERNGWMTHEQFLDALALTSLVPGPLLAVATFVGYMASGPAGAAIATTLVFAPAFCFTLLGHEHFERILREPRLHAFLLGVTAAVVGQVLASSIPLAREAITGPTTASLAVLALGALLSRRVPVPVVLLVAGVLGAVSPFP